MRVTVPLDNGLSRLLDALCDQRGQSRQEVMRDALAKLSPERAANGWGHMLAKERRAKAEAEMRAEVAGLQARIDTLLEHLS